MEVEAAIWDIGQRREAARRAGFPGKGIYTMVSTAEKADAMIAAARPEFGALARDGMLNAAIAELKVETDREWVQIQEFHRRGDIQSPGRELAF